MGEIYSRSKFDLEFDFYGKRFDIFLRYVDDGYGDGVHVYACEGKAELYGVNNTSSKSSTWIGFDDYGHSITFPFEKDSLVSSALSKIVKRGVQKFRVKILAESGG